MAAFQSARFWLGAKKGLEIAHTRRTRGATAGNHCQSDDDDDDAGDGDDCAVHHCQGDDDEDK